MTNEEVNAIIAEVAEAIRGVDVVSLPGAVKIEFIDKHGAWCVHGPTGGVLSSTPCDAAAQFENVCRNVLALLVACAPGGSAALFAHKPFVHAVARLFADIEGAHHHAHAAIRALEEAKQKGQLC